MYGKNKNKTLKKLNEYNSEEENIYFIKYGYRLCGHRRLFLFLRGIEFSDRDAFEFSALGTVTSHCASAFDVLLDPGSVSLLVSPRFCMRRIPYATSLGQLNLKRTRNELNTTKETVHMCKIEIRISLPVQGRNVEIQLGLPYGFPPKDADSSSFEATEDSKCLCCLNISRVSISFI